MSKNKSSHLSTVEMFMGQIRGQGVPDHVRHGMNRVCIGDFTAHWGF